MEKIGPFTLPVWVLIVAAGIGVGMLVNRTLKMQGAGSLPEIAPTVPVPVSYGPTFPQSAPLPIDRPCPAGLIPVSDGQSGWTCAAPADVALMLAYQRNLASA